MSRKSKIILAISCGAAVGALGVCATLWQDYRIIFISASALVALISSVVAGISIEKKE